MCLYGFLKSKPKYVYEQYNKYSLTITVDTKKNQNVESMIIKVYDDGKNLKVTSNDINLETYIIGNKLYYLKDKTFYIYNLKKSYNELYKIISKFVPKNGDNAEYFSYTASKFETNEFLDCIHIDKKTKVENVFKIRTSENKIDEVDLKLVDLDSIDEVLINLKYTVLEDDYKIDVSKIYSSNATGIRYKFENTKENPYVLLK